MNGPQHYAAAERMREQAAEWMDADWGWKGQLSTEERLAYRSADLADATVHAILAVAAAVATNDRLEGMSVDQLAEWLEVIATRQPTHT